MKLYNSLTRKKEEFKPIKAGQVLFYHCGPTVYWAQHIGNLRGMLIADLIRRSLEYLGYKVNFVRNYTDVGHLTSDADEGEDKMDKASKKENLSPQEIADKYIKIFEDDCRNLNIIEPTHKPRVTEYIKQIQDMVHVLLDKGFAYTTDLAVYFDVSKAKDYNRLTGQKMEDKIGGAGKAEVEDKQKRNPADFTLWFFKAGKHKSALQFWPSPFKSNLVENGEGFPGWHIECSVMSKELLGDTFDIHMGGIEHMPVHHTNEIAQSESANGVKMVNYWVHNEHLVVEDKKMAKSEGTSYSLAEIKEMGISPLDLRYFFLQAHYRSKQNFTKEAIWAAHWGLKNFCDQVYDLDIKNYKRGKIDRGFRDKFIEKISDDFNIPQALAVAQEVLKSNLSNEDKLATVLDFDKVFGLSLEEYIILIDGLKKQNAYMVVEQLAEERKSAKEKKDYAKADGIRSKIEEMGYNIEDLEGGKYKIVKK